MRSYSLAAQSFLVLVWCFGLAAVVSTFVLPPFPGDHLSLAGVGLAMVLAGLAGGRKVKVSMARGSRLGEAIYITPGFLINFATLLAYGIRAAVLVSIVGALSATLAPRRHELHKILFNVAAIAGTVWLSGVAYALLNHGQINVVGIRTIYATLAAVMVYFLLNVGCVAGIITLSTSQSFTQVFRQNFLWTAPSYFAAACCAAMGQTLLRTETGMILLLLPILVFLYYTYQVYADKVDEKQRYIEELMESRQNLAEVYISTVRSLATAIDAKDQYTHAHLYRVQHYAVAVAEKLGVQGIELEAIRTGALLHDIGKLGVPDYVLLKPGPLSADEFDKMKRHPTIGAAILEPVQFPWPVACIVKHHHERWDGTGYPDNLRAEAIPQGARILSVADVYDALTSERPYRPAWSRERTLAFLQEQSGKQFDPAVVAAFLEVPEYAETEPVCSYREALSRDVQGSSVERHIRRNASELWVLYEVSQTLNSGLDMRDRLELLARKLTAILPGSTCSFNLYDPLPLASTSLTAERHVPSVPPQLQVWAAAGANADILYHHRTLDENSPSACVARARRAYRGVYRDDNLTWSMSEDASRAVRSVLSVPLVYMGDTLGTISFYHANEDAFTYDDEHLLHMIAEQVESVLYRYILFDRTRSDALTDSLTGLYNIRYLMQAVEPNLQLEGRGEANGCALLYLDLDNFKTINDTYGHQKGSIVLRDVARLLPQVLRPKDVVIRYGGDEFLVVLPQTGEAGAQEVAQRIRAAVHQYRPTGLLSEEEPCLDVSIGIACAPRDGTNLNGLVALADQRMYENKAAHKASQPRMDRPEHEAVVILTPPLPGEPTRALASGQVTNAA